MCNVLQICKGNTHIHVHSFSASNEYEILWIDLLANLNNLRSFPQLQYVLLEKMFNDQYLIPIFLGKSSYKSMFDRHKFSIVSQK